MKLFAFLLGVSLSIVPVLTMSASANGAEGTDELKLFEGEWVPETAELAGDKFPPELLKAMKLTIKDGKYSVLVGKQTDQGIVKVVAKSKPKAIDIVGEEGPNKGKTIPAIYEFSPDSVRICYDLSGKKRPAEFKSDKGSQNFLVLYKRAKN